MCNKYSYLNLGASVTCTKVKWNNFCDSLQKPIKESQILGEKWAEHIAEPWHCTKSYENPEWAVTSQDKFMWHTKVKGFWNSSPKGSRKEKIITVKFLVGSFCVLHC